ncbi:MAG: hypothetical protein ACR2LX_07965 [Jatrophihabitans sp.]
MHRSKVLRSTLLVQLSTPRTGQFKLRLKSGNSSGEQRHDFGMAFIRCLCRLRQGLCFGVPRRLLEQLLLGDINSPLQSCPRVLRLP